MAVGVTEVVVRTAQGQVRGHVSDSVIAFRGIPYAAPPFGPNRFRPPEPHAPWDAILEAREYGPTVPKPHIRGMVPEPVIDGDECLNLNIWTPEAGPIGLPVMVWIHGGGFAIGSNAVPTYDGTAFARHGVVCVGINYRLGVDGFLFLGDGVANLGLLDQIAALQWVRDNIAGFGGDPDKVTIAGESAGGMSVATLLSMSVAEGLFRRGIAQSGAGHHVLSPGTARRVGGYLADKLGVPATREALAQVPLANLYAAQLEVSTELRGSLDRARWGEIATNGLVVFGPVVDGDVLRGSPIESIAAGAGAGIDLLAGNNAEEWRLFTVPNGLIDTVTEDALQAVVSACGLPAQALEVYRAARPYASPGDLLSALMTDWSFRIPALRLAEAHAASQSGTYVYEFRWRSPAFGGRLGACHAAEIAFAFDNVQQPENAPRLGSAPPQPLADEIHHAWVSFIATGDPGWPQYQLDRRSVRRFGMPSETVEDPAREERRLWEGIR